MIFYLRSHPVRLLGRRTLRGCEDATLDQLLAAFDVELLQELDARLAAIPVE